MANLTQNLIKLACLFLVHNALADNADLTKIEGISYNKDKKNWISVEIQHTGPLSQNPELVVKDSIVQVVIPSAFVWPKIEKKFAINNQFDTTLMAYQFNKDVVRVRAILPFSIEDKKNSVQLTIKDKKILLQFPVSNSGATAVAPAAQMAPAKKLANKYDEGYLNKLLNDKDEADKVQQNTAKMEKLEAELKNMDNAKPIALAPGKLEMDKIKTQMSASKKGEGPLSNFNSYIGKFLLFMALFICGLYVMFTLFKKGVLKRGKLGFLNNTKVVDVLNTTYVGPKKSLLLVKVSDQVFLLGSSEKGLDFLTEVKGVNGLMKQGELEVSGNNFDTSIEGAQVQNKDFKLKEVIHASEGVVGMEEDKVNREKKEIAKVKLSDQIKRKVKGLKALQ